MAGQTNADHQASDDDVKRIYRSETNKVLAGVCGGIAEYFHIDPLLVRLGWVVVTLISGVAPGLLAYVVAAIVMPVATAQHAPKHDGGTDDTPTENS